MMTDNKLFDVKPVDSIKVIWFLQVEISKNVPEYADEMKIQEDISEGIRKSIEELANMHNFKVKSFEFL